MVEEAQDLFGPDRCSKSVMPAVTLDDRVQTRVG